VLLGMSRWKSLWLEHVTHDDKYGGLQSDSAMRLDAHDMTCVQGIDLRGQP